MDDPKVVQQEATIPPADLWDAKVKGGMSPDAATAYVARVHGPPPRQPLPPRVQAETTSVRPNYMGDRARASAAPAQFGTGLLRSAEQGATFGFGDEINAGARALMSKDTYSGAVQDERAKLAAYKEANPGTALVSELGGAVGGGLLGGAAVGAAGKALGFGAKAVQTAGAVSRGQNLVRGAQQVASGAAAGGVAAAGSRDGSFSERMAAVPAGAAFGAGSVLGLKAVGGVARATGVGPAVQRLLPRANAGTAAGALAERAGVMTTQDLAHADVLKQLERAGLTIDQVADAAKNAHPDMMLLDPEIGGRAMLKRARGASSIPSRGADQIESAITERAQGQPGRVQEALESNMGHTRENTVARAEGLAAERKSLANVNYPKAYDAPPIEDPDVLSLFSDPAFRKAHQIARRMAKREGVELPPLTRTSDVGGVQVKELVPQPVQAFDWMKHGLDDLIETGSNGARTMGRNEARITRNKMSQALERIDAMPEHAPYAEARRVFREGSQKIEAQTEGLDFLKTPRDELAHHFPKMTPDAQNEFRHSALSAIEEKLASAKDGRDVTAIFQNPLMREKLATIFPTAEAHQDFIRSIEQNAAMHKNGQTVLGGSPTARIQAEQADGMGEAGKVVSTILSGPGAVARSVLDNALTRRMRGLSEEQINALAPLLTAKGPELDAALARIRAASVKQTTRSPLPSRAIGQAAGAASARP